MDLKPYFDDGGGRVVEGDCVEIMAGLESQSVDAVVTDPPYGLGFMSKAWDKLDGPGGLGDMPMRRRRETNIVDTGVGRQGGRQRRTADFQKRMARDNRKSQEWHHSWAEQAFRVSKPGAHLLAFGGTRTYHRMAVAIEDAGWEIRDCLVWAYASGFPKSHNFDDGWGTALKPAWEPIIMARKPMRGTVAQNREEHGPGALNIDATRIPFVSSSAAAAAAAAAAAQGYFAAVQAKGPLPGPAAINPGATRELGINERGRWPANVILTDPIFDGDTPGVVGGGETNGGGLNHLLRRGASTGAGLGYGSSSPEDAAMVGYDDEGTYSRFFLIPKADRAEREPVGLNDFEERRETAHRRSGPMDTPYLRGETMRKNTHPTVKPVDLMRHLVRLVTPPGGLVLDPFLGSGTTAIACELEGFRWLGIEKEPEYVAIARARLLGTQRGLGLSA